MTRTTRTRIIAFAAAMLLTLMLAPAAAVSGHFITGGNNAPVCTDQGTTVECAGKVAGLGGTTFEITVDAIGIADVECRNHGGNVAPGQDTEVTVDGTTGELLTPRNGNYNFTVSTDDPEPLPSTPTCPNNLWTAEIVDVTFTDATLTLLEDGEESDQITVAVN